MHYAARVINSYTDADLYMSVDRAARAERDIGNFFMNRGGPTCSRRFSA